MIVYSKKIIQFMHDIKSLVKKTLSNEMYLKVHGERFFDKLHQNSYPIRIVIYNDKSKLGYFDPNFYELGFHECLMHSRKEQLQDIIRHELAHYALFINNRDIHHPHGTEFRAYCQQMGWGEEVYRAASILESNEAIPESNESSVCRKIRKLMALATSSNPHEAELAMIKSQQLLLKHNIDSNYLHDEKEEKIYLKRIMKQKKRNAKMRAIAHILETFFVNTVYMKTDEFIYLEILGDAVNIEIAEYVADVLHIELDKLWKQAQLNTHLKGAIAKNSFFLGIAKGYCNKIQALKREYNCEEKHALMIIEKKLIDAKDLVYQRLSATKSSGNHCAESSAIGEKMGRQLNIHPAINRTPKHSDTLKGYLPLLQTN